MPHAGHLSQVLAEHDFQEGFKNYRDLRFLSKNLQQWTDSLGVFDDMLATRREAYAQRLPLVRAKAQAIDLAAAAQLRADLQRDVTQAEEAADGLALATTHERALLALRDGLTAALEQPGSQDEVDAPVQALRDRVRRVSGALTWQLAQDYPARIWDAKQSLATIATALAAARQHDASLAQAQADEPLRFERFAQRIESSMLSFACSCVAGNGVHSSNAIVIVEPSKCCTSIERSGVRSIVAPSRCDWKITPCSLILRSFASDIT